MISQERMFPVLYQGREDEIQRRAGAPTSVPWSLLAPHEAQARRNHDQSLERLAERGGLGLCEMVAVLEDRRWRKMDRAEARARIEMLMQEHETAKVPFADLDPGIRETVRWLNAASFRTTDSGDGVSKREMIASGEALGVPHVAMRVHPRVIVSEANRLLELVIARGLISDPGTIQATYDPADGIAMIMLIGISDDTLVVAQRRG